MLIHTFLDKCNTITEGSDRNAGFNPVLYLLTGRDLACSRALLHFPLDRLKKEIEEGNIQDVSELRHVIKFTNCGGIVDINELEKPQPMGTMRFAGRASSMDVILFLLPMEWDRGRGCPDNEDFWTHDKRCEVYSGSTWFQPMNGYLWPEEGVYSRERMEAEYEKYMKGEESIIVAKQHFDLGNENLELDVTSAINAMLEGKMKDFGFGLMFSPWCEAMENMPNSGEQCLSFFTDRTNTFFEPYLESSCDNGIFDDRASFYLGKENRLFLYVRKGGALVNLDEMPTCTVEGKEYEVKRLRKGIYYINITLEDWEVEKDTILSDVWSNIVLERKLMPDVEMEFVTMSSNSYFSMNEKYGLAKTHTPSISGISDDETLKKGEKRTVKVDFRLPYTVNSKRVMNSGGEYRIYAKELDREIDVIPYSPIEHIFETNFFIIDTNDLVPHEYFVDIKTSSDFDNRIFENVLSFNVADNITNMRK